MSHHTNEISWSGWGDPNRTVTLSPELRQVMSAALRISHPGRATPELDTLLPAASRLLSQPAILDRLADAIGAAQLVVDAETRVRHMRGKSTPDLLRLRNGDLRAAPDAVAFPTTHEDVVRLLEICAQERIAVVPFGGGTSVVGGLEPQSEGFAGVLAISLRRMDRLLALDEISRTATLEPGLRGPEAEALLAAQGYTIGHYPQSFEYATIGGFAATRSSGQSSAGYRRFDEVVVALRIATPAGTVELGNAPRSAAGPDLRQLFLGSEGALGVITAVTVEILPTPAAVHYEGWRLPSFQAGGEALRRLAQDGPLPTVLRLSDEAETGINQLQATGTAATTDDPGTAFAHADPTPGGALAIVGYEGTLTDVSRRRDLVAEVMRDHRAEPVAGAGEAWVAGRFDAPYLRDAMLDAGALVETLETATFWSKLPVLYDSVRAALVESLTAQGAPPVVMCHISHVYRSGASLYFTVACAELEDPISQWSLAKAAASDAIVAAGGSITHHHGIGRDHRPWYERQLGPVAIAALRAVKASLDPAGIMNPGVLLP